MPIRTLKEPTRPPSKPMFQFMHYSLIMLPSGETAGVHESRAPGRLNFIRWRLTFLGPLYGTFFMLLRILRSCLYFWKSLHPDSRL